jgi:hypothetical protein
MKQAIRLSAWALALGTILGTLEILLASRMFSTWLDSYREIRLGTDQTQVQKSLSQSNMDCASSGVSQNYSLELRCADYWWSYSFYFDPETRHLRAKRFSPREHKSLILRYFL